MKPKIIQILNDLNRTKIIYALTDNGEIYEGLIVYDEFDELRTKEISWHQLTTPLKVKRGRK